MSTNNSSLLDHPTTIEIGDDDDELNNNSSNFLPEQVKTEPNKDRHHQLPSSSSTFDRKRFDDTADNTNVNTTNIMTETSSVEALSPDDIDQVIKGFQQELDTLSNSLDKIAATRSQSKRDMMASVSAKENPPPPPPPPHEPPAPVTYYSDYGAQTPTAGTTASRKDHHFETHRSNHRTTSAYSSSYQYESTPTRRMEEPPLPVETPVVSAAGSSIRTNHHPSRSNNDSFSARDDFRFGNSHITNSDESYGGGIASTTTQQTNTIQKLKETLEEQNLLIRRLQRENHELRKQLSQQEYRHQQHYDGATNHPATYKGKYQQNSSSRQGPRLQPMFDGSNRPRNDPSDNSNSSARYYNNDRAPTTSATRTSNRRPEHHERFSHYYDDEPMRPTTSSLTTIRSTDLLHTTNRDDEDDENTTLFDATTPHRRAGGTMVNGFTPGTRFVAELAKYMTIQQGQNVPLSIIIDKHWDKLKFHMRDDAATTHTANDF